MLILGDNLAKFNPNAKLFQMGEARSYKFLILLTLSQSIAARESSPTGAMSSPPSTSSGPTGKTCSARRRAFWWKTENVGSC